MVSDMGIPIFYFPGNLNKNDWIYPAEPSHFIKLNQKTISVTDISIGHSLISALTDAH